MRQLPLDGGRPPQNPDRDPVVRALRVMKLVLTIIVLAVTLWQALGG
ncbi:hypothetical protein [Halocalculus aciditolerans]|uniref:Uncharacterized protein n=1 Tax=Halocalculus aciditolerans TaxID=1383812 RepID=A0A830F889_9EURY|nr:hypothetical protein [Halocalculus aciditolerans]GGL49694.1 hypothetical protein GCM10009039_04810 [Halocalculus aciditolerans]